MPNYSVKASPNGGPPGPRYSSVYRLPRGPGILLLLVPPYLKR